MSIGEPLLISSASVPSVQAHEESLTRLLGRAAQLKPDTTIDPPLQLSDFEADIRALNGESLDPLSDALTAGAAIGPIINTSLQISLETAARDIFYPLIAELDITSPSFVTLWNLLDIIQFCSDLCQCEPGVPLRLIEELLDSQTIDGSKHVCDYMESRRERLMRLPRGSYGEKERGSMLRNKQMILLRSCNELLRRLSRAEDAVHCGRVFIFLFQSFPLGDKSAINLRAEFHKDNVTMFDDLSKKEDEVVAEDAMQVDEPKAEEEAADAQMEGNVALEQISEPVKADEPVPETPATEVEEESKLTETTEMDNLYTSFWSLQQSFSNPPQLFQQDELASFKEGLTATIKKFQTTPKVVQTHGTPRTATDVPRGTKRKRNRQNDAFASNFNPKYLTSRDLFELELSDLTFQRHILVQSLILIDFLLSLSAKGKKRTADKAAGDLQRAMLYDFTLSEDDAKWAQDMRSTIAAYLQNDGLDGKYYYRMADTVLTRDKNWVQWKAEDCKPPISKPPVSTADQLAAIAGVKKMCAPRRIKANPMGAVDLSFLSDDGGRNTLESLKNPDSGKFDSTEKCVREVEGIQLDLEMATGDEETYLQEGKTTATWRALRVAARRRFNILDKVEDSNKLQALKQSDEAMRQQKQEQAKEEGDKDEETVVEDDVAAGPQVKVDPPEEEMDDDGAVPTEEAPPDDEGTQMQVVVTEDVPITDEIPVTEDASNTEDNLFTVDAAVTEDAAVIEDTPVTEDAITVNAQVAEDIPVVDETATEAEEAQTTAQQTATAMEEVEAGEQLSAVEATASPDEVPAEG